MAACAPVMEFQSTLPVRGATFILLHVLLFHNISIHAPRAGSDRAGKLYAAQPQHFNPRSPCGERPASTFGRDGKQLFQSTLPVRGATLMRTSMHRTSSFQSTLPVRGATVISGLKCSELSISIHAPRAGSDDLTGVSVQAGDFISIHAPRAGSDNAGSLIRSTLKYFNPRSPCGERPSD